ncbi:DNA polymerase III subunit gamma/tau [Beduini massiliensis]|uniref:DNA polymerase III subunit gamma/tau n=1 Tax=Beduini massiliensis TaxID=1585974 RepID=UPI00059A9C28|nr:DNA polymerase III subunit gamma/tau [Beduini massiliensis]
MAYKALYRSYRPQNFEELAGQQHIVKTLKNAVKQNKIAHAYLFCGPRGTGKTTVAKILAKAINCTCDNKENIPCDECENCISIMNGTHPDIVEIDAASNNGVDEVRDLIEKVKYAPIEGKYKVYIIDEVHMMSTGAFNALLKTLEEPPAHVVFVLATTEPHKILPTIISRCQRFDFSKINDHSIVERLETVLEGENIQCEREALELIASLADGGMRDALSILEQCLAYSSHLTVKDINEIYGIVSATQKLSFLKSLMNKDIPVILNRIEEMFQTGIDVKRLTTDLIDILKDIIIYKNTQDKNCLFVLKQEEIEGIVPYITAEETFTYIDILIQADQQYKFASNAKLYFELAMLKIANKVTEEKKIAIEANQEDLITKSTIKKTEEVIESIELNIEDEASSIENDEPIYEEPLYNESPTKFEKIEDIDSLMSEEPILLKEEAKPVKPAEQDFLFTNDSNNNNIEVDFNDILNILVQANKKVLMDIQEKWSVIQRYKFNLNTAKLASMLCDGQPVAASSNGLVIAFEFQPMVNQINNGDYYVELKQFLLEILGMELEFIAVLKEEWPGMRNRFIELKRNQQLPQPRPIQLSHIHIVEKKEKEKTLTEAEAFGVKLFGDLVEIKGE